MLLDTFFSQDNLLYLIIGGIIGSSITYLVTNGFDFVKRKISKGPMPKIDLKFNYYHSGSSGVRPRIYKFDSKLFLKNIDKEIIYNVSIQFLSEKWPFYIFTDIYGLFCQVTVDRHPLEVPIIVWNNTKLLTLEATTTHARRSITLIFVPISG